MEFKERALKLHKDHKGKIEVKSKVPVNTLDELSIAYTPGVAEPCKRIADNVDDVWEYTARGNLVAVVTDGSAVLGLGNIGAEAAMPVMEGKSILFKQFGGIDAFPLCVGSQEVDDIVNAVKLTEPTWGGVNLEDIGAPACFEIEDRLKQETNLPIFHDDQHGTAIVAAAGVINGVKCVNKNMGDCKVVINGAGAGGIAVAKIMLDLGVKDVILCDSRGIVYEGRPEGMNWKKAEMAQVTNKDHMKGSLADALKGSDVFLGVSVPGSVTTEMVKTMNEDAILFAMANPVPEIYPDEAKAGGATIIGTGGSNFPNQINNVLAFPGVLRGALDVQAKDINESMKIAAAYAIAGLIEGDALKPDYVIPDAFDERVVPEVAKAVARAAVETKVSRKPLPEAYK